MNTPEKEFWGPALIALAITALLLSVIMSGCTTTVTEPGLPDGAVPEFPSTPDRLCDWWAICDQPGLEQDLDGFYDRLQEHIESLPKHQPFLKKTPRRLI